ncbi:MarR family winged helix-turn-helix transcriptional regulator [Alkalicoccobacillus murimartini]|uniref:DNA-binding MarR family transcriptional regulator n=1 Tax=Alkalicoccobacillus murimartini TaxID=171685 RepID=A0ABT9YIR3_9BACI|nr:MarR family transcriptional regulator [Alkalicoccobacillus murimartini]MDQ0207375.1 DNA-binding MarR family transcriptional regulator [Alkalicoccobacillus murimartini]
MDNEILKLENQICFKMYTAEREIMKMYRTLLEELDVTYSQYLVLLVLWEKNAITVKELGEKLSLDSGTLTPMLKRMESHGLLKRKRSVEDERSVIIRLTAEGEALKQKAECIPSQLVENLSLEFEDYKKLDELLTTFLKHVKK